jgi:hypothetical protein
MLADQWRTWETAAAICSCVWPRQGTLQTMATSQHECGDHTEDMHLQMPAAAAAVRKQVPVAALSLRNFYQRSKLFDVGISFSSLHVIILFLTQTYYHK